MILGTAGSELLDYLAIDTWLEFLISATIAFPFIVLVCWFVLLDKGIKNILLNYAMDNSPASIKKILTTFKLSAFLNH